jgi:Protein of unknown function (DUF3995)
MSALYYSACAGTAYGPYARPKTRFDGAVSGVAGGPLRDLSRPPPDRACSAPEQGQLWRHRSRLVTVSLITAGWGLLYAMYRGYYGFGGTVGMFGTPTSETEWRAINLAAAALLLVVALLPVAVLPLWQRPRLRPVLLALCWVLAVGFTMHGLIDDVQRVLSLTGTLHIKYPIFTRVNRHAADIQDLVFNETWFLTEGILWGFLGWIGLGRSPGRGWWIGTALAAIAVLTVIGLLSAFGVFGKLIIG